MDFNTTQWNNGGSGWENNNNNNNNNNYSAYQNGQGGDDDIAAAIAASLASIQSDDKNRNKYNKQSSVADEDADLAMALKLSAEMYQSQKDVTNTKQADKDAEDTDAMMDDENGDSIFPDDDKKENEKAKEPEEDYQFSDDDGDKDFEFDENADYDGADDAEFEDEADEEFEEEYEDEEESKGNGNDDNDGWGADDDLIYDGMIRIEHTEETQEQLMKRLKEKRRREQGKIENFWKCGKCQFLNHPSRPICMMCNMPELDVVHHILQCPKNQLKICIRCAAYVVPHMYDNHLLDCKPLGGIDNAKNNQAWYVKLTPCEQNAINHVNGLSIKKSNDDKVVTELIKKIGQIDNGLYAGQCADVLQRLYDFMNWTVPIIIRIRAATLIPILMKDTHYRSLFEINPHYKNGANYNRSDARVMAEEKMFGPVYNKATVFERPKYGCLNVGLRPEGCLKALGYGDCYFLMNDATVRWRTTLTIQDSFAVNGNCGTVKHCNHLLIQLQINELKELIEAALFAKKGGVQQSTYREIQIHGPVQLNRDIISLHVPDTPQHKKNDRMYREFCTKNMCKLVYFNTKGNQQFPQMGY